MSALMFVLVGEHLLDPRGPRRLVVGTEDADAGSSARARLSGAGADRFERNHHRYVAGLRRQVDVLGEVDDRTPIAAPARRDVHAGIRSRLAATRATTHNTAWPNRAARRDDAVS